MEFESCGLRIVNPNRIVLDGFQSWVLLMSLDPMRAFLQPEEFQPWKWLLDPEPIASAGRQLPGRSLPPGGYCSVPLYPTGETHRLPFTWPCLGFNRRLLSFRCLHEGPAKIPKGDCVQSNRWITADSVSLLWNKKNAQSHPFRYEPALLFKKNSFCLLLLVKTYQSWYKSSKDMLQLLLSGPHYFSREAK